MGSGQSRQKDEPAKAAQTTNAGISNVETPVSTTEESSGGCPMKRSDGSYSYDWKSLFRPNPHGPKGSVPLSREEAEKKVDSGGGGGGGGCPVKHSGQQQYNVYSQPIDPKNQMPKGVANQLPSASQSKELSTERVSSSIPKGGADDGTTWTYPSPQMFYNALSRKGKLGDTDEDDISSVVALHNNMNEKTWKKVLEWEALDSGEDGPNPKLLKFMGRPQDLSPKARFKYYVMGHPLPYDRHDWTVLREDGTTVRYVIDYYHDETRASEAEDSAFPDLMDADGTKSLLVDVRPALDGPWELFDRVFRMPYARRIANSSSFEPLPLLPTPNMKSQVAESQQVWDAIQKQKKVEECNSESVGEERAITRDEAVKLHSLKSQVFRDCKTARKRLSNCKSEEECEQASMDVTMCIARIVCPLQYKTLGQVLESTGGNEKENEARQDAALENVSKCVMMHASDSNKAQQAHPDVFN